MIEWDLRLIEAGTGLPSRPEALPRRFGNAPKSLVLAVIEKPRHASARFQLRRFAERLSHFEYSRKWVLQPAARQANQDRLDQNAVRTSSR